MKDASKLKFSKISPRVNYIINTAIETMNTAVNLNEAFKEEIVNGI